MKKLILSSVVALSLATSSNADFLGAEAGVASWMPSLSGTIKGSGAADMDIDFQRDLGYEDHEANVFFWAYFDHPIPLIPNIKVQQTNYNVSSTKATTVRFNNNSYTGNVDSELTLNQLDIIPYWRILDNWINLDLGFNLKTIDGNIKLKSPGASDTNQDFSITIPMAYAKARFDMPFTGLSVEADMSYLGYGSNSFTDMKAGIVYQTSFGLGATAGLRKENLTLDDIDSTYANIDINGVYLGVFYHF